MRNAPSGARAAVERAPGDEQPEDGELIAALQRRDEDAVRSVYRRYCDAIYRYAYYQVGDVEIAEDIVSEVFLRMLEKINTYSYQGLPFRSWLYQIAHNLVVDHFRARNKLNGHSVAVPDELALRAPELADPAVVAESRLTVEELQQALTALTEEQRRVILLRFVEDLGNREVAAILGKSEPAVKSLQYRALDALRRLLSR